MGWVLRGRYVIAGVVVAAVGGVALVGLMRPKDWVAEVTVVIEPLVVPGLHSHQPDPVTATDAVEAEVVAAESERFREAILDAFDYPVDYEVADDPGDGTLTFRVTSDSSFRAYWAAFAIGNGYVGYGRGLEAAARAADAQYQLGQADAAASDPAAPAPSVPRDELEAQRALAQGALDQLAAAGGGRVVVAPQVPDDPVAPPMATWLIVASIAGLVVGLALARLVDRRHAADGRHGAPGPVDRPSVGPAPPRSTSASGGDEAAARRGEAAKRVDDGIDAVEAGDGRRRVARVVIGVVLVGVPVLLGAAVLAGYLSVWELRPASADEEERKYDCLEEWVASVPDGAVLALQSDESFFRDSVQEFSFPRLTLADADQPADVVLRVVPGDGPQACGGYHIERQP